MSDISVIGGIYLGIIFVFVFLLYEKGKKKYEGFCNVLEKEEYPLKSLMVLGYSFMEMIRYPYNSPLDRKIRQQLREIKEEEYIEFYLRTTWAYAATVLILGLFFSGITALVAEDATVPICAAVFGGVIGYVALLQLDSKIQKRHMQIAMDLPDFTNKLLILSGAGLSLKAALIKVSKEMEKDTPFYQELKHSVFLMENGTTDEKALDVLCVRCNMPEVRRMTSVLLQNFQRGGTDILLVLREINKEMWNSRKSTAKRLAEEAGTKLLFPMMLMLFAVIIMVGAPAVMSMNMGSSFNTETTISTGEEAESEDVDENTEISEKE